MHERRYQGEIERLRSADRVERLEVKRVVELSLEDITVTKVLDIGTGSGLFAEEFASKGLSVSGIDPNPDMLIAAKDFVPSIDARPGTVENIPFPDHSFELIFMGVVLHESDDLEKALAESRRCATKRVSILEWAYQEESFGPPLEHRLKPADIASLAAKVGYTGVETIQLSQLVLYRLTV